MRSLVVITILAAAAAPAFAQSANAQADMLFKQARAAMAEKKYEEACTAFAASQKLDPAVTTLMNLADCREKNGQLATAWGLFLEARRQTQTASDAAGKQLNKISTDKAAKLEPRLSKLTIAVAPKQAGLAIQRDGTDIVADTWGIALPIDGGPHTITATAPGRTTFTTSITVGVEGDAQTVSVPVLGDASAVTAVVAPPVVAPAPVPTPPLGPEPEGRRSRALPITLTAGAVVLAGVAVGFELSARGLRDDSNDLSRTIAEREDKYDAANHRRYIAVGFAGGALVCAGAAVYLWIRGDGNASSSASASRGAHLAPMAAADAGGLSLSGAF